MTLLNLGAGGQRYPAPWINVDTLREQLVIGTPERDNLDAEPNYVEHDLRETLPWHDDSVDGILAQHLLEHLPCHDAVRLLAECRRVLVPGGVVVVSVPDAEYFLRVLDQDTKENAVKLFGEPITDPKYGRFFEYALFHREHVQVLTHTSLKCLFIAAGLEFKPSIIPGEIYARLNRLAFSTVLMGTKPA